MYLCIDRGAKVSFGLKIKNINSDIVIDTNYANFGIFQEGTFDYYKDGDYYYFYMEFPECDIKPILAVNCNNHYYLPFYGDYKKNDNEKYYRYEARQWRDEPPSINYALLLPMNYITDTTENFGLKIYNDNGLVFSSNFKNFIIKDVIKMSIDKYSNSFSHTEIIEPYYLVDGLIGSVTEEDLSKSYISIKNISSTSGDIYLDYFDSTFVRWQTIMEEYTVVVGEISS